MTRLGNKYAAGWMARPWWRAGCLMISLLAVAAISVAQPQVTFSVYPTPFFGAAWGITAGPDGALWFVNGGSVWRMTTTGLMTEYVLPDDGIFYSNGRFTYGIAVGSDGALWFTERLAGKVGRISTAGVITEYPLPGNDRVPVEITAGPDGALWFTEQIGQGAGIGGIGRITTTGVITEYALPPCLGCGRYLQGITAGPDGELWFTDQYQIHRMTTTGLVHDYDRPPGALSLRITTGPDGALWFTGQGIIGRITTTGLVTTFPVNMYALSITSGPDGALWFTSLTENIIGRITLAGQVSRYSLPPVTHPNAVWYRNIALGPDGALWITNEGGIVRASVSDTTPPVITPQINGTLGSNGWYRSAVTLSWTVTDPESGIASSGCDTTTLAKDTPGVTLACSAINGAGLWATKLITIKIDQTPPAISGMPGPDCSIWPPSHKMVQVAAVTAGDALSGIAGGSFKVTGSSNEPPSGPQISIVQSAGAYAVALLAERSSDGTGRVYTLRAVANDQAGNTATVNATCTVPHDQGN
jgi:virginiamycin B lyase